MLVNVVFASLYTGFSFCKWGDNNKPIDHGQLTCSQLALPTSFRYLVYSRRSHTSVTSFQVTSSARPTRNIPAVTMPETTTPSSLSLQLLTGFVIRKTVQLFSSSS